MKRRTHELIITYIFDEIKGLFKFFYSQHINRMFA